MTRKRKNVWSFLALAVGIAFQYGGAILSYLEKFLMRAMGYLTLLDDWEEYAKPLWDKWISPMLAQGIPQLVLDVLTWALVILALLSLAWLNFGEQKWKERQARKVKSNHRLSFVFRHQTPFYEHVMEINQITGGAGVEHHYYVGIRNDDKEMSVRNVKVKLVGASHILISRLPLGMCSRDGESVFDLSPGELKYIRFISQNVDAVEGGGDVVFYCDDGQNRFFRSTSRYALRLAAYGRNAHAFQEIPMEFDQDRGIVLPMRIGDYPEGEGQSLMGSLKISVSPND